MIKSTLTALCALFMAGTAMAGQPKFVVPGLNSDVTVQPSECNGHLLTPPSAENLAKAPARLQDLTTVIYEAPEGRMVQTMNVGTGYQLWYQWIMYYENQTTSVSNVVYGDDGMVYLYNIMPYAEADTYVKGYIEDGKLIVPLPQTLDSTNEYGTEYGINLAILELQSTGENSSWWFDTEKTSVTFTANSDGSFSLDLEENEILGLVGTLDNQWVPYGVEKLTITPFDEEPLVAPTDTYATIWSMYTRPDYGYVTIFGQKGEDVYITGICKDLPDASVKATMDADKSIKIYGGQYLGIKWNSYIYLTFARRVGDNGFNWLYEFLPEDEAYVLNYDEETNTYSPADPEIYMVINNGKYAYDAFDEFDYVRFVSQYDFSGTPAKPAIKDVFTSPDGYVILDAFIPVVSTDNTLLLSNFLSYIIYTDDEPFEFDAELYELEESLLEVPYDLTDTPFIHSWVQNYNAGMRTVYVFAEGFNSLAIQSVYNFNGEATYSDIVPYDPSGINEIASDKAVTNVSYFDLAGRAVVNPVNGLYIERTTFSDGTTSSVKKAIR